MLKKPIFALQNLNNYHNAKFKKKLGTIVKNFLKGHFESGLCLLNDLNAEKLSPKMQAILGKLLSIYILGQLLDLPTLHSILSQRGIKSNLYQINYQCLLSNISHRDFINLFELSFKQTVKFKLQEMCKKDSSIWSKTSVTVIIDDSIFKQWLTDVLGKDKFYSSFYSGQYNSKVYGFKVLCLGVSIAKVFYPLYIEFVPKKIVDLDGKNIEETACDVAGRLIEKWGLLAQESEKEGFLLPKLCLSCDNGYSNVKLSETCETHNLIYMSVPKVSHNITIDGETKKISDFINIFMIKESNYIAQCKKDNQKIESYTWRVRVKYKSQNREVVLLFFRLNKSNKVSVIYTTNLNIKEKSLRRHWFDRTYIEQFFKLLKHSMKIQNTIVKTREAFENKLYIFMFIGFYLQFFVRYIRTQFDFGLKRKIGLEALKKQLIFNRDVSIILDDLLQTKTHAKC